MSKSSGCGLVASTVMALALASSACHDRAPNAPAPSGVAAPTAAAPTPPAAEPATCPKTELPGRATSASRAMAGQGPTLLSQPAIAGVERVDPMSPQRCVGGEGRLICLEPGAGGSCRRRPGAGDGNVVASCSLQQGDTVCLYRNGRSRCTRATEARQCEMRVGDDGTHHSCQAARPRLSLD